MQAWRPQTHAAYRTQLGPHGGEEDSGGTVLHPLLSRPLPQQPAPAATPPEAGTPCGASQERGGGRTVGVAFHYPRPLPLVKVGVRSEWLTALHGRGSARLVTVAPLCGFGR